ncbi:hypothetical protein K1719_027626 [Acacia pycnantha]|nr:hypothetical protein K1719_027626 [Acacia pycnantha]
MDIALSLRQTLSFDQIQTTRGFAFSSNKCLLKGGIWRKAYSRIHCSSMEPGLRPRPMPKPSKIGSDERQESVLEKSPIKNRSLELCSQIEKLFLCIRYREALFNYMVTNGFELDLYMRNKVLLMHVKCGMMIDACKLFDEMPERNLLSWNTILAGLVRLYSIPSRSLPPTKAISP